MTEIVDPGFAAVQRLAAENDALKAAIRWLVDEAGISINNINQHWTLFHADEEYASPIPDDQIPLAKIVQSVQYEDE